MDLRRQPPGCLRIFPYHAGTGPYTPPAVPQTMTGPMVNIFTVEPVMSPSACVKTRLPFLGRTCYNYLAGRNEPLTAESTRAEAGERFRWDFKMRLVLQ